ncbi:MAG: PAS domain S-box protein [Longimicrobiales bacterium]|nr:PAS domain S-box protein [Longimicrobiales bacterium]
MVSPIRILNLEDRPEDSELAQRELRRGGLSFDLARVDSGLDFARALEEFRPGVILCDYSLPGLTGLEALAMAREKAPDVPVIIFTGTVSEETAVACLKAGAVDYVLKDKPIRLLAAVEAALKNRREREEKTRAEEALRESESRYRTLVDSASDAIVTVDSGGRISLWNAAAEDVFGYSALEMVGGSIEKVIPERFRANHAHHLEARARAGQPFRRRLAVTAVRSDGLEFPAEISLFSVSSQGDVSFTAVVRDLTERMSAQKALEELSGQHELLLSSAGEGILGLDPDGSISFANPAALTLLGREASDLLGQPMHALVAAPGRGVGRPGEESAVVSALREGREFRGELDLSRSDGSPLPAAVSMTPVVVEGVSGGGVMIFKDITARRASVEALRASEAQYRGLVDNAPYGIYRSSAEGRFLAVNPALVEMLGYESEDAVLGLDLARDVYLSSGERERVLQDLEHRDRAMVGIETTWVTRDGAPLPVRLSGRIVRRADGASDAFEMLAENLTERRLLEEQLRQAQKMEAVGQLTGGIAHDFNNVLAVILLNSELAIAAVEKGGAVDLDDLHAIQDAAKRATAITRKLLGFSRRADLHVEPTDLSRVVSSMSGMLRTALPETIELAVDIAEKCGTVMVDAGSIEQMLLNLVSNSRDALPRGGRVGVKVHEVDLDHTYCLLHPEVRPGRHACLEVLDNGVGMDAKTLARVFDPFFTTKAPGSGTGLGMAMVYGLTKQQQGYVSIDSHPGEGTTVRLLFPVCEEEATAPRGRAEAPGPASARGTILLVEDEDNLRPVTAKVLAAAGYRVLSATTGTEALAIFTERREDIDLILSDLVLPGMGGMALLKAVRALHGPVRFVLTSGYFADPDSPEGARDPSVPFLRKPWSLAELLAVLRRALAADPPPIKEA